MQPQDKPQNGIAGLKHWRYDLLAGVQVALVSLPLSLGIAVASGAPPVTGVISAIIAGLVFPFFGGANVTISGPAAGLAPALLAGMLLLGNGDLAAGYPLLLVAICLTGLVQIILSVFKAGRLVAMFLPVTVVEAMLAAIGLMIIVKQIPPLLGSEVSAAKSILESITSLPDTILLFDPVIVPIGLLSLFLMFYLNATRHQWLRRIPAPLVVCGVGILIGHVLTLDARYLITMPADILDGGITLPAFDEVWRRTELWGAVLIVVITLTLIDGIESLATIAAVDKIDPYRRKSNPNVTLRAMGASNMLSSLAGGLTIIPGGVKSRVNIDAGGRTLWANFYNALFLVLFLFFAKDLISRIPLAAIGAILVYVGWRLCEPQVFAKTYAIGRDQIMIFIITVIAILVSDLLTGILIGVAAEILMLSYLLSPSMRLVLTGRLGMRQLVISLARNLFDLFRDPVLKIHHETSGNRPHYQLTLSTLVGFNLLQLDRAISAIPHNASITLTVNESSRIIDHTVMEYLHQLQEECLQQGRDFTLQGVEEFHTFTQHPLSSRKREAELVHEKAAHSAREQTMLKQSSRLGLEYATGPLATLNLHDFVYLRRGENRSEHNVMTGEFHGCHVKLFDYNHTAAPDYYVKHHHTLALLRHLEPIQPMPDLAITPGHYLERYLVEYQEITLTGKPYAEDYQIYAREPDAAQALLTDVLAQHLQRYPGFYLELRNNVLLVFRPGQELEASDAIPILLSFAELLHHWSTLELPDAAA